MLLNRSERVRVAVPDRECSNAVAIRIAGVYHGGEQQAPAAWQARSEKSEESVSAGDGPSEAEEVGVWVARGEPLRGAAED